MAVGQTKGHMLRVKYPRALVTRFDRGQTMGPPGERELQAHVLKTALGLLHTAAPGEIRGLE